MKANTFNFGADLIRLREHSYFKCTLWNNEVLPVSSKIISICTGREEAHGRKRERGRERVKNKQGTGKCCFNWSSGWHCGFVCACARLCVCMLGGLMVRSEQAP